jgi:hypothetical protein
MTQLRLLILLLLVSFKGISQTDTIKKIVLNEKVTREVIKDLVKGDLCKQHLLLKEEEIKNLQEQNDELVEIIKIKDNILSKKDEIITVQDKAIGWWKKPELHGYLGIQTVNVTLIDPYIYGTLLIEFPKFSLGGQYFLQPNNPSGYGIIIEYNLF